MIHPLTMAFFTLRSIDDDDEFNKDNKDGDDDNEGAGCEYHRSASQLWKDGGTTIGLRAGDCSERRPSCMVIVCVGHSLLTSEPDSEKVQQNKQETNNYQTTSTNKQKHPHDHRLQSLLTSEPNNKKSTTKQRVKNKQT